MSSGPRDQDHKSGQQGDKTGDWALARAQMGRCLVRGQESRTRSAECKTGSRSSIESLLHVNILSTIWLGVTFLFLRFPSFDASPPACFHRNSSLLGRISLQRQQRIKAAVQIPLQLPLSYHTKPGLCPNFNITTAYTSFAGNSAGGLRGL